ncbi:MAG: glutaredoxin family protein [Coriobacteriia bacterium]|nr:glutaredoxin family protein [Coriobacteriia bacterium]
MPAPTVTLYCRTWCSDCHRAKDWLETRSIPYVEIDVDRDAEARALAESLNGGRLHTPTIVCEDGVCVDFRPDRLCELLGVAP